MCYSKEDGGQRCSYHTGADLERAQAAYEDAVVSGNPTRLRHAARERALATIEHATTTTGRSFLAERMVYGGPQAEVAKKLLVTADKIAHERSSRTQLIIPRPQYGPSSVQNSKLVTAARDLAYDAHGSVRRRSGEPYINHPRRVAETLAEAGHGEEVVAAAWLHDTVEDTWVTLDYLDQNDFPPVVVSAVDAVSHRPGEYYYESVERAAKDDIGLVVKMSDNQDNTHPEPTSPERFARRQQAERKYLRARTLMWERLYGESSTRLPYTVSRAYYSPKPEVAAQ